MRRSPRGVGSRRTPVGELLVALAIGLTACGSGSPGGDDTPRTSSSATTSGPAATSGPTFASGPTGTSEPAPTTAAAVPSAIGDAFEVTSERASSMTFIDWDARKRAFGVSGPSSAMSDAERADFFHELYIGGVEQGSESTVDEAGQFERWGFTAIDLAWESRVLTAGAQGSTIALAFDDEFDVASLAARFEECGYDRTGSGSATVYSTDAKNECLTSSGPVPVPTLPAGMTAAGLAPDQHLMVLSFDPKLVADALEVVAGGGAAIADHPEAAALAGALETNDSIGLLFGTGTCTTLAGLQRVTPQQLQELKERFGGAAYVVLAVGQVLAPADGTGTIAFLYLDPADADADLAVRRTAHQAPSFLKSKPYSDFVFVVDDARAADGIVTLSVSPPDGASSNLEDLFGTGDMTFALCK